MNLLDETITFLRRGAEKVGTELGPGDDWQPMLAFAEPEVGGLVPIPSHWLDSGASKDALAALIRQGFTIYKPTAAAFLTSSWIIDGENMTDEQMAYAYRLAQSNRLGEHPLKTERLTITGFSPEGGRSLWRMIKRSKRGVPRLVGEWEEGPSTMTGRFAEALADAVGYVIEPDAKREETIERILLSDPHVP